MKSSRAILLPLLLSTACASWPTDAQHEAELEARAAKVLVTPDTSVNRDVMLVDVIDCHTSADSEDKGFDTLRMRAALLGADAVLGAEFEHGDAGELSHLSGMAVRYIAPDERPFDVVGKIDIVTPEDDDDKGMDQLQMRANRMGADQVRNIHFEHGEEGGESHLTGLAVKHRGS